MKKSLLVLSVLAMIVALVAAAPASAAGDKGLMVGLTMSKLTGSDADAIGVSPDYRTGFAFGAYMDHSLSPSMALHTEALYAMKGAKYEDGGDSIEFKLNYLQVPVLLKMQGEDSKFFFCAGPDIGIKMSAKTKATTEGVSAELDMSDDVKSLDLGLTFGAGIEMTKFSLEARYTMGLSSIDSSEEELNLKNSGFMFLVGMGL